MKKFFKSLIIVFIIITIICIFYNFVFTRFLNKYRLEQDSIKISESSENSPFSISKIVMYSSGYAENKNTNFQKTNWILDILQYSDIAIYIDKLGDELNTSNTVKKLYLENINLSTTNLGNPSLYYLDSLNFGTPTINENYKIENSFEFTVLNDENKNADILANTPVFFTDCSNPITLKYVNNQVKEDFTLNSNEPIFFNGKLLKMANINLKDLEANITFTINLESNDNKKYLYELSLPICLNSDNTSIYDGSVLIENKYENYKFLEKN